MAEFLQGELAAVSALSGKLSATLNLGTTTAGSQTPTLDPLDGAIRVRVRADGYDSVTGTWTDIGGEGNDLQLNAGAATAPTQDTLWNRETVTLNGVDQYFQTAAGTFVNGAATQPTTIFAFATRAGTDGVSRALCDGFTSPNRNVIWWPSANVWRMLGPNDVSMVGGDATNNAVRAFACTYNGSSSQGLFDDWDTNICPAVDVGAHVLNGVTLGAAFNGTVPWIGTISEFIVVEGATAADFQRVREYGAAYYPAGLSFLVPTASEAAMQTILDNNSALDDVTLYLLRVSDGRFFKAVKGAPNERYISSSTVKPVTCLALEWAIHKGWLSLTSLAVDLVPEFSALATNQQRNIQLQHLMSFTSGLFVSVTPSNALDWQGFVNNCASLATANSGNDTFVPGTSHTYATDQHALASVMAVNASPYGTWDALMTAFIADTGLFPGATWANSPGLIFGGNVQINITVEEYAAFWEAVFEESVLSPARCQDLYADAIPSNPTRTTTFTWLTDNGYTGEDWHFGRGVWLEQRNADWDSGETVTRFSTVGNAGQYSYYDTVTGVALVVSVTFPEQPANNFMEGFALARSIDSLVATWTNE